MYEDTETSDLLVFKYFGISKYSEFTHEADVNDNIVPSPYVVTAIDWEDNEEVEDSVIVFNYCKNGSLIQLLMNVC